MISSRPWLGRLAPIAGAAILLALYYVMAVSAAATTSLTFDEMAHLTAGYTYWTFDDYRLHPENGNWPQRLAALPAIASGAAFPALAPPAWTTSDVYAIGDQFLYASGNDADALLGRGRAVMALLGVILGLVVFVWTRRLVSPAGAWVSLVLFAFSPTFLAHGALVTSDMASALFFTAATGAMWIAMHRVTPLTVLGGGVLLAGAFLSKLSAPILVPIAAAMLAVRLIAGRPLTVGVRGRRTEHVDRRRQIPILMAVAAAFAVVTLALVWASFGFRYSAFAAATTGQETFLDATTPPPGIAGSILSSAQRMHLLPQAFLYGTSQAMRAASERAAFLNGEFSTTGWWWYFPYAFAVKTTIPALMLGALALAALAARWSRAQFYAATPILALVTIYWMFALTTHLNIGHRHLLPIYPALCMLAGGAALWLDPRVTRTTAPQAAKGRQRGKSQAATRSAPQARSWRMPAALATLVLLAWHVVESAAIRPHYLAYVNQFAGGPSDGYRHLADSSLDWGQDLPALKEWLNREGLQRPGAPPVYLSYFGTARPAHYGIQATALAGFIDRRPPEPPVPLGGGVYCVSATMLDVIGHLFYTPDRERDYRAMFENLVTFARASEDERAWSALIQKTGEQYWRDLFVQFDRLRTGRLTAFLRQRQPDANVGYSILIYRLSDAEVDRAVNGPPPGEPAAVAR